MVVPIKKEPEKNRADYLVKKLQRADPAPLCSPSTPVCAHHMAENQKKRKMTRES
jgi:hypothetical protein